MTERKAMLPPGDSKLYSRVFENIDRAIIALNGQGTITLFNPTAQTFTGFSERQALGRSFRELFAREDALHDLVADAQTKGRTISAPETIHLHGRSEHMLPVSVSACPLLDQDGHQDGVVLIIRDLTRMQELEEAVRRADRLAMLSTLAAGLAHEVKNPLGGIKGAAQLLAMELGDDQLCEYTDVMIKEVDRVNVIIEELMDLSRPRPPEWSEVNLTRILNDIVLFQNEAHRGRGTDFRLLLDPSIPPFRGDSHLLTRLFLNLIKNAAEAVGKQGQIDIRSRIGAEVHLTKPGTRPVPFVVIDIIDNGRGISAEDLDQIFMPFFTSKSKGIGLGLATCQKIVAEHDGFIKVTSSEGEGTTFSVSLPFIQQSDQSGANPPAKR
jgi:two-component system, NtrC family, nitrogen regulation sensor histidine kinase GlnL